MIIFVDIDGTICRTNGNDYINSVPLPEKIATINELYHEGNKIVYWTARGSTSGTDWTEFTEKQLRRWGCLFDEIRMDKPPYDVFYEDKSKIL